jgi:hypothetical protein
MKMKHLGSISIGIVLLFVAMVIPANAARIKSVANGFVLYNLTQYDNGNLTINNSTFSIYVNYITPNYVGISINNVPYELYAGEVQKIHNGLDGSYYVNITSIMWTPIHNTFNMDLYEVVKQTSTIPTTTTVPPTTTIGPHTANTVSNGSSTGSGKISSEEKMIIEYAFGVFLAILAIIAIVWYALNRNSPSPT